MWQKTIRDRELRFGIVTFNDSQQILKINSSIFVRFAARSGSLGPQHYPAAPFSELLADLEELLLESQGKFNAEY